MKRAAEDEGGDAEGAEETMDVGGAIESSPASESVTVRMWMTNSAAGTIIGKGGINIKGIREQSGSKISISELVQGATERLIS